MYCITCQSEIEEGFWRGINGTDENGGQFEVKTHFFPPCFDLDYIQSRLPNCTIENNVLGFTLSILKEFPTLREQIKNDGL